MVHRLVGAFAFNELFVITFIATGGPIALELHKRGTFCE